MKKILSTLFALLFTTLLFAQSNLGKTEAEIRAKITTQTSATKQLDDGTLLLYVKGDVLTVVYQFDKNNRVETMAVVAASTKDCDEFAGYLSDNFSYNNKEDEWSFVQDGRLVVVSRTYDNNIEEHIYVFHYAEGKL